MHIKEICLEGFKSYATRTVVPGFDPYFNAITGLNGSGKSNILDSICFVLGITNLQQVRASNLQELVYKQGQAGITKATVSVVFDNSDRTRSPLGYEDSPEITVTRQVLIFKIILTCEMMTFGVHSEFTLQCVDFVSRNLEFFELFVGRYAYI